MSESVARGRTSFNIGSNVCIEIANTYGDSAVVVLIFCVPPNI